MRLIINQLRLTNFKGIKSISLDFNDDVTKVFGRNGSGKSTLADGISYCLFGKDSHGNTQFGLKTRDAEGNEIPHLEHGAELSVTLDGVKHELGRILREKWTKQRGSDEEYLSGNVVEYYVDHEKVTKKTYDEFVFNIAGDEIFRLLTIPSHFPNLLWQEQRDRLCKIVPEITDEDVIGSDDFYKELTEELKSKSMEAYLKSLSYSIRELKKKIDEMPVKVETLKGILPEARDWSNLEQEITQLDAKRAKLNEQINQCKAGNASDVQHDALREKMRLWQTRLDNMQSSKRWKVRTLTDEYEKELRNAKSVLHDAEDLVADLQRKRMSLDNTIDQCNESIKELKRAKESGAEQWQALQNDIFTISDDVTVCPTCGQYLPEEQVKRAIDVARADFKAKHARRMEELSAEAGRLTKELAQAEALKAESIEDLHATDEQVKAAAIDVKEKKKALADIENKVLPTVESLLKEDENYQKCLNDIEEYKKQLNGEISVNNDDALAKLNEELDKVMANLDLLFLDLAQRDQYNKVHKQIEDTKELWKSLNSELTNLERKQDVARSFNDRRDAILELRVNSLFKFTKFQLYRRQVDGTKEPFCTATYNGVEYKDLNTAAKIAVGLDIINALAKHYDVFVPVVVDNSEAILEIPETLGQRIELYVSNNSELTIL